MVAGGNLGLALWFLYILGKSIVCIKTLRQAWEKVSCIAASTLIQCMCTR